MDTPDKSKSQITPSISTFEESPVFNFLNNLSPINSVKSTHIPQSFNSLSFSSPPSIFTSPHLTSVKESRFIRRHQLGDPSKPEFSSDNTNKENIIEPSNEQSDLVQKESNENKEAQGCDWETISNAADYLIMYSSNQTDTKNDASSSNPQESLTVTEATQLENVEEIEDIIDFSSPQDDSIDPENVSNLYRGIRRRSLVFDVSGASKKPLHEISSSESNKLNLINENSMPILPSIGLHLNSITTNSEESILITPNITTDQELTPRIPLHEENLNSPKNKRPKLENGENGSTCKRCNCKKSKCLKLYCECFAAGVYCVDPCSCLECFNKPIHEETVLNTRKLIESRNPLAFAPKVIQSSETLGVDPTKTPASARHKRGCNCKKSGCLKKYCECYQGGVGCSINCRCEGCKNAFGRKDGGSEVELEEESNTIEKSVMDRSHHRNNNNTLPLTPRESVQLQIPFPLNNKPIRTTYVQVGSSSSSSFVKGNLLQPQKMGRVEEHETNGSPISKSPNSKRVRVSPPPPPQYGSGQKSSRKLILQSIPSFPSLTPKQ